MYSAVMPYAVDVRPLAMRMNRELLTFAPPQTTRWVTLDELESMHHACSVNVIDELMKKLV
jgi:hypothetical protein